MTSLNSVGRRTCKLWTMGNAAKMHKHWYFLHWPFFARPSHKFVTFWLWFGIIFTHLQTILGLRCHGRTGIQYQSGKCHCLLSFFVLIRLADWRILVPITCRKSCNLFWASQRKSMQTLFPVSALLWLNLTDSFASSCLERKHGQIPALKKTTLILFV